MGCCHRRGFQKDPIGWKRHAVLSQGQRDTQLQGEPERAESAAELLGLADREGPQHWQHQADRGRRAAQGPRHKGTVGGLQLPPLQTQGLLEPSLLRGRLGEECGVG